MENVWTAKIPRISDPAPDFVARTSHGERKLSDYRGSWLLFFSHPADFTPVCTSEFIAFARAYPKFRELGCELLGLSVDSVYSHIAWLRNIKEKFGIDVPFPVVADLGLRVAHDYGMVQQGASDTSTVRACFLIDPEGIVRAMIYYPMTTGRSIDELLRLLQALQTSDREGVATPEGWQPGDRMIVPAPATLGEAEERLSSDLECTEWYFAKKEP